MEMKGIELIYKHDFFSLLGNAKVYDENNNVLYKIKGKFFTITQKRRIYDKNNKKIFTVRNKFWKLIYKRAYVFDEKGKKMARVSRKITIKQNYKIEGFEQDVRVEGSIFGVNYTILVDGKTIALINNNGVFKGRKITIYEEEDAPFVVALLTAIYNIIKQDNGN